MNKFATAVLLAGLIFCPAVIAQTKTPGPEKCCTANGASKNANQDVIDFIEQSPIHTTFAKAIIKANLVNILKGPGPFTLFAPSDAAFEKMPAGTVANLLKSENSGPSVSMMSETL